MTRRLDLASAAVLPWQMPELDATAAAPPLHAGGGEARPVPAPALPAANGRDHAAAGAPGRLEDGVAKGYAEGFERGLKESRDKGYAAGLAQGQKAAEQRLAEQAARLAAAIKTLTEPIRELEKPVEEAVVALALEVARRVIGGEVARSRAYLVRLIREAIAKVPIEMGAPKIILSPADVALVLALAPDIESGEVALVGDESVEAGGCLVVADAAGNTAIKDKRWHPRARDGASQVDLTLAARWRGVMLTLFDGEEE